MASTPGGQNPSRMHRSLRSFKRGFVGSRHCPNLYADLQFSNGGKGDDALDFVKPFTLLLTTVKFPLLAFPSLPPATRYFDVKVCKKFLLPLAV